MNKLLGAISALLIIISIITEGTVFFCLGLIFFVAAVIDKSITNNKSLGRLSKTHNNYCMIELGVKAKDKVTGFSGTVTGRAQYLFDDADSYRIEKISGDKIEGEWFTENRIEVENEG